MVISYVLFKTKNFCSAMFQIRLELNLIPVVGYKKHLE